jgi:hypothetical protein
MGEQGWRCRIDGQEHGPLTDAELRLLARDGDLKPDDLVWREGMQDWRPAKGLKGLFGESAKKPEQPMASHNPIADGLAQLAMPSQQAKTGQPQPVKRQPNKAIASLLSAIFGFL